MPNRCVVRVDPQGQTMVVDIFDTSGVSVAAYESSLFAAARRSLPLTIHAQTDFCLAIPGSYDVSCKVGGTEVAAAGARQRVEVGDIPVRVAPDWERELTASPPAGAAPADRWMSRYAGAIDWATLAATIPWTEADQSVGSPFGEWSVDGTTFTFTEDVRASVIVQIAPGANAAAQGVIGIAWSASAGTADSQPGWTNMVDEGQHIFPVAPDSAGRALYQNVQIYPELLWKAGNTFHVITHTILTAGAITSDGGTDITIFASR